MVDNLAGNWTGNVNFVNDQTLNIGDLTYSSACGTTEAICGLDIDGDLDLDVNGDLTQTGAIIVSGTTAIDANGDICLTGADCTGDGVNDNDFGGTVTITGTLGAVELVDRNDLTVNAITATNDIFLRSGDGGSGSLTLNDSLTTTGGQVLLQSDSGITQAGGVITATDLLLGGDDTDERSGVVTLTGNNEIDNLAINWEGNVSFTNNRTIDIADLTYSSACGTSESICGVNLDGDLVLDITGDITQSASIIVSGTASLTATGDICLTGGDCTGDGLNDNDFQGEVTASGVVVEIVDANALITGLITADDDIFLRSGDNGSGSLTLNDSLTTTGGQVLLQSDSGITQAGGVISATDLLLGGDDTDERSGVVTLTGANEVDNLAVNWEGNVSFTNNRDVDIADLSYASACGTAEAICGLNIDGDLVMVITGDITQSAAVIVTGTSDLTATETICLTGGDCTGDGINDNDFGGDVSASGSTVEIVDINDLGVGVITATDDIFLRAGDVAAGALTLNGNLTATQILLQADSGITQSGGVISATDLLLGGDVTDERSGTVTLTSANEVDNLAANWEGNVSFTNNRTIDIGDLTYSSACGTSESICGLNIDGDLVMDITGDITQSAAVIVTGTSDLTATGTICLTGGDCTGDGINDNDFQGEVTASGSTVELVDINDLTVGVITATDDIFLRAGDVAAGALTLNGNLTATQILLQADSGITQAGGVITATDLLLGGDVTDERSGVVTLTGNNEVDNLAINWEGNVSFTNNRTIDIADLTYSSACGTSESICGVNLDGDLVLDITGDITQSASIIVSGTASLTATGDICLTGGDCTGDGLNDNDFQGEVTASGVVVEIVDANALITGLITADDDIFLRSGDNGSGSLTLNDSLTTTGGQVLLQSDSGITQAGGVISATDLLLGGDDTDERSGVVTLTGANEVDNLAVNWEGNVSFTNNRDVDIADLSYASACGTAEAICGLNIDGDLVMDITGDITQSAAVIVTGTSDLTATETICLTGGDCTGDGINDNDFQGEVTASGSTVEIVDINDLGVGVITATDDIFLRAGDVAAGALTLNGNLTATQILLQADSGITQAGGVISATDLLLGGDVTDEGSGDS